MTLDTSAESFLSSVPAAMGTQHPDSASRYVPIQEEVDEAVTAMMPAPEGMGIEEFMVDFEGKMTPYHQTADIAHRLLVLGLVPGRDVWITPRIPNATEETVFRQLMALMSIIEADYDIFRSHEEGAIREVILPMVRSADDLVALRRRIEYLIELAHKEFGLDKNPDALQVIPLIETIPGMLGFKELFRDYLSKSRDAGFKTFRARVMIARSDSALAFGLVPSLIASKLMICDLYELGGEVDLPVAPVFGGGALPFRGHVTAGNFDALLETFPGIRTITIQSGVRYDYPEEELRGLVGRAHQVLGKAENAGCPVPTDDETRRTLQDIILRFAYFYMQRFEDLSALVSVIDPLIPQQRDRLNPRSPSGYSRTVPPPKELDAFASDQRVKELLAGGRAEAISRVPRAISFVAALYSIGLPPEFIGLGEGLERTKSELGEEGLQALLDFVPCIKGDIEFARRFLSLHVAARFFSDEWMHGFRRSLETAEDILGVGITGHEDRAYTTLLEITEPLLRRSLEGYTLDSEDAALLKTFIIRLGKMRGSLG